MLRTRLWSALGSFALAFSAMMLLRVETAHANVIQQIVSFGPFECSGVQASMGCGDGPGIFAPLEFNGFDPSQGTLTAVSLTLTSGVSLEVRLISLFSQEPTIFEGISTVTFGIEGFSAPNSV